MQPRHRFFARHAVRLGRTQRSLTPCAHRLGELAKRQRLGRVMSPGGSVRRSPDRRPWFARPGSHPPRSGFSAPRQQDPTRLPRIRLRSSIEGQLVCRTPDRGAHSGLSAFACPEHPCRAENDYRSRPDRSPSPSLCAASSSRLSAFLGRRAKMPRIRFYNRRSRHEHPRRHLFRSPFAVRRGKPASVRRPDRLSASSLRPRFPAAPDRLSVIRPPTASRLTARRRLRARRLPRSARPVAARRTPACERGDSQAFSAEGASVDSSPLTPLFDVG